MKKDIKISERSDRQGIKKKIIIAISAILISMALLFVLVLTLESISKRLANDKPEYNFNFYEADYEENIFEDKEYVELIKNGYIYYNNGENVTVGINDNNASSYGEAVEFLINYINIMISGDVDGYNKCYSELYYSKEKPKESFTMQKIYDVNIVKISESQATDDGKEYMEYLFSLSYKILKNNGTLRDDFLEGSRTQYIYFSNRSGEMKIDGISTSNIK